MESAHFSPLQNKQQWKDQFKPFEEDLIKMIEDIKFWWVNDHFQATLSNDLENTQASSSVFVFTEERIQKDQQSTPIDKINTTIRRLICINVKQWRNSQAVIEWYKKSRA